MSTRPTTRWKIPDKLTVSRETALEICRRPTTMAILGCLCLAAVLTVWGLQSNSNSVTDSDLTDEELESDFLVMGAVGISDSANPGSDGVNTQFNFDNNNEAEADSPIFDSSAGFLNRTDVSVSTPDFEPEFESEMPRFGRPLNDSGIRQAAAYEPSESSYSTASGARVTANQAVWLTGSIETR